MEKTTGIKNIRDLRSDLIIVYNQLRSNKLPLNEAKEISNMAGKIISSVKIELVYALHRLNIDKIDFLESAISIGNGKLNKKELPDRQDKHLAEPVI